MSDSSQTTQHVLLRYAPMALLLTTCVLSAPASVQAQGIASPTGMAPPSRPERPYRGLFGGGVGETAQKLTLELSLGGGVTENPLAQQGFSAPPGATGTGRGATGTGSVVVDYSMNRDRWAINASNVAHLDFNPQLEDYSMVPRDIATFAFMFAPTSATNITVSQGYKNLPEFSFADFFDAEQFGIVPFNQDLTLIQDRYQRYGTSVDLSHRFLRRTSVTASLGYGHGMISSGHEWKTYLYSVNLTQNIARGVSAYVGYAHGEQREAGGTDRHPTINAGIDVSRALSLTRRTTISFSTGLAQLQDRQQNDTSYHVIGAAALTREFGRTWHAALTYNRNARYVETLSTPLFTDAISGVLKGSFSRRIQVQAAFGKSIGHVGSPDGDTVDTIFGSAAASFALTRMLAIGIDYSVYKYAVGGTEAAGSLNQQGLRTYVQLWVPLITRNKRP